MSKCKINGKVIAIQIGRDETQIVLMGGGEILHGTTVSTPAGAMEDGMIRNQEAIRAMLKLALNEEPLKHVRQVVFSLCTSQVITETVQTPSLPEAKLEKLLQANSDTYFPVDMKDYHLAWQVVDNKTRDNGLKEMTVQLWAVPLPMISRYYAVANACGLSLVAIDYCGHSVATAVGASYTKPVKTTKAPKERKKIDLNMEISFSRKKKEEETPAAPAEAGPRYIPDTELYISLYSDLVGLTFVQDEQVVMQRFIPCGANPADQVGELTMMVEYFRSMEFGRGSAITGYLCGPLVSNSRLTTLIGDMLGMQMQQFEEVYDPKWLLCVGAANTTMDFGRAEMNHPSKSRSQVGSNLWQFALILVGGAAVVGVILLTLSSRLVWDSSIKKLESTRLTLTIQSKNTAGYADKYNNYLSKYNSYSSDWDTIFSSLRTYNDNLVLMLEELESTLPENTSVTSLQIAADGLTVQFACASKEEAAYLIMALRELKYADLKGISNLSGGGGGPATSYGPDVEEAPSEGSYTLYTVDNDLVESLISSSINQQALFEMAVSLSPEQVSLLQKVYGAQPSTTYKSLESLKEVKKPNLDQRKKALQEMLNTNPFALQRFAEMANDDLLNSSRPILMGNKVLEDLMFADEEGNLLSAVMGGGLNDPETLLEFKDAFISVLIKDDENVTAAENLISAKKYKEEGKTDVELWYIYYLEVQLKLLPAKQFPYLNMEAIIEDLLEGSFNTGDKALDSKLNAMIPQNIWELLETMKQPDPGPGDDPVMPELTDEELAKLLGEYLDKGTTGNDLVDKAIEDYLATGSTGYDALDDKIDQMMEEYIEKGETGNEKLDAQIDKLVDAYIKNGKTGYPHLDKYINTMMKDMLNKYLLYGTTGNDKWDAIIKEYLGEGGDDPTHPGPGTNTGDTRIYFTVQLSYNEELMRAELDRKGLDYDDKIGKMEVFAE